ncbi:MAG: RDD family protein [Pseudomonadaceae bacterium]|nr:RDD family protein [Pseudomonadaceae bacterium]
MTDPYRSPSAALETEAQFDFQPVGFWIRLVASIVDSALFLAIVFPLSWLIYGDAFFNSESLYLGFWDGVLNYVFPIAATIAFWKFRSATPGKMIFGAVIVDADSHDKPSTGQLIGRYFSYIPATLVFFLGFLWIAWDPLKQGWHDKLAGTMVVRRRKDSVGPGQASGS